MRRAVLAVASAASLAAGLVGSVGARPPSSPTYQLANVGAYGGGPSIVSHTSGRLYDAGPNGGTVTHPSTHRGKTRQPGTPPRPNSGADSPAPHPANAGYPCHPARGDGGG